MRLSCKDTIETTTNLVIGDTVPPPGVELLRSTVLDDFSNQIDYKRSTASDFASYIIYFAGDSVDQVNDVDQLSYFKNGLNTLHNSYCYRIGVKNACGLYAPWQADEEDCTVEVTAVGDTNKVHLNWNAYAGWDDVERYVIYKEEKENSGNYLPLDSVNGSLSIRTLLFSAMLSTGIKFELWKETETIRFLGVIPVQHYQCT
jgi:hypothetical protein